MRQLDSITDSRNVNLSKRQEIVKDGEPGVLQSMGQGVSQDLVTEQQHQVTYSGSGLVLCPVILKEV